MKFIFPQNYNFNSKLLGCIDYSTVILNIIWGLIVFLLVHFLIPNATIKICIFIILFLPFALFSIIGFNHERIIYIIKYLYKYFSSPKVYLYKKVNLWLSLQELLAKFSMQQKILNFKLHYLKLFFFAFLHFSIKIYRLLNCIFKYKML